MASGAVWSAAAQTTSAPAEPAPIQVVVQEARPRVAASPETRVGAEEARRGAGTQGDAIKALQALPGLARAGAGAGEVIAWGSAPRESKLYVDGVEVPALYHGSGIRSVVPSGWVSRLSFLPGAYGVDYGRGVGGVVSVETRPLDTERWHGALHVDPLDAGVGVSLAPGAGVAVAAAFRQSLIDRWLPALERSDVGSLLVVPTYRDWQAKLTLALSAGERLDVGHLGSWDRWSYETPSSDPANRTREQRELEFERWYLRYVRDDGRQRVEVVPFVGIDRGRRELAATTGGSALGYRSTPYGVRASQRLAWGSLSLRLGVDALGAFHRVERDGTLALPAREGDPQIFAQLPGTDRVVEQTSVHILDVAPHAELSLRAGPLTLTPGIRLDTYLLETDRVLPAVGRVPPVGSSRVSFAPEPRLAVELELDERARLLASAGIHHQAPDAADLSASFGNPELGLARSLHVSGGEELRFGSSTNLSVLGYYKTLSGLAVRSPLPTPELARVLLDDGEGRSFGVQFLLRQGLSAGWSGWISCTLSKSERWRGAEPARAFDYDQPLVASAVLNKRLAAWSFAARARFASGSPRTPVIGASSNLMTDRDEPIAGTINSSRLPDFFQLDLRVDRSFELGALDKLVVYADALNVTGSRNAEEIVHSADYRDRAYLRGLPPLVVFGARLER